MIYWEVLSKEFEDIKKQIEKGVEWAPFLFLAHNIEVLNSEVLTFLQWVLQSNNIDMQSLFHLSDDGESLKIEVVKTFLAQADVKPRFAFQIFFIENISRMTTQAANACLKFFEEPWVWNIIFLTNTSESWILETILSRVQVIQTTPTTSESIATDGNDFYLSMITSHVEGSSDELVRYFFSWKYEKHEYIQFLRTLIVYISKTGEKRELLDEIHEDIGGILKNNLQGRYIVDKYILLLWT